TGMRIAVRAARAVDDFDKSVALVHEADRTARRVAHFHELPRTIVDILEARAIGLQARDGQTPGVIPFDAAIGPGQQIPAVASGDAREGLFLGSFPRVRRGIPVETDQVARFAVRV